MIPITIGSYPILDEPPRYSTINTIAPTIDASINLNANETDSNVNLRSALSAILNNEQVVRPQSTVPAFDDAKNTDVDGNAPYPHYGKSIRPVDMLAQFMTHPANGWQKDTANLYTLYYFIPESNSKL